LEQSLLQQFEPTFMVGQEDCSNIPAEFDPGHAGVTLHLTPKPNGSR
jgi:hypothetical protein